MKKGFILNKRNMKEVLSVLKTKLIEPKPSYMKISKELGKRLKKAARQAKGF